MVETTGANTDDVALRGAGKMMAASEVEGWFVREVLPLEATLMQFLHRHCRNRSDVADLCQDVYVRVYENAREQIPERAKSFVLTTARNLLIDRVRRNQVIPIQTVADLEALHVASDEPGPDRDVMARGALEDAQTKIRSSVEGGFSQLDAAADFIVQAWRGRLPIAENEPVRYQAADCGGHGDWPRQGGALASRETSRAARVRSYPLSAAMFLSHP